MLSTRSKYTCSIIACLSYFTYGLMNGIYGVTMMDIAEITSSSFGSVSLAVPVSSLTYCFGSLFFGWTFDYVNRQKGLAGCMVVSSLLTFAVPLCKTAEQFILSQALNGFVMAGIEVALHVWILRIWNRESNACLQSMHFCNSLGTGLMPVLSSFFLSTHVATGSASPDRNQLTTENQSGTRSLIIIPFGITAIIGLLSAGLIFLTSNAVDKEPDEKLEIAPAETQENINSGKTVIIMSCFLICFSTGVYLPTTTFLPHFLVFADADISKSHAAFLTGLMIFAVASSRAFFAIIRISPKDVLCMELAVLGGGIGVLVLCLSPHTVWLSVTLLGAGLGGCLPAIWSLVGQMVSVSSSIGGCLLFCSRVLPIVSSFVYSSFLQQYPTIFIWTNVLLYFMTCLTFVTLILLWNRSKNQSGALHRNHVGDESGGER